MPPCPANYERLVIPAGVAGVPAGTVLKSCYRVIRAPNLVQYNGGSVSMM